MLVFKDLLLNVMLQVLPYIKTSLSPGSGVVTYYLRESGVVPYLQKLGFDVVGYGCMTCIGNSGPLEENIANTIESVSILFKFITNNNLVTKYVNIFFNRMNWSAAEYYLETGILKVEFTQIQEPII